jgi:hypothetical protein
MKIIRAYMCGQYVYTDDQKNGKAEVTKSEWLKCYRKRKLKLFFSRELDNK